MATVPLSGTSIRLLSGVPFSNDYKNTRWFDDEISQTNYFLGKQLIHSVADQSFQRIEGHTFISVNKNIDELWGTNYLMFKNPSYSTKWFYAFVTKLEYRQKNTTYVHFQIDVFQTWKFHMDFKPSYVVREHCKLWNADGTPVINTVDEGLDYGSDYETVDVTNYRPFSDVYFLVIVTKQTIHYALPTPQEILPNVNGLPQPLCYYVHPFKRDLTTLGPVFNGETQPISPVLTVLKNLYKNTDSVNNVVSLYVTDHIGGNITYDEANALITFPSANFMNVSVDDGTNAFSTIFANNLPNYSQVSKTFPNKYASYTTPRESKLLMHPYTALMMDDLKGNKKVIKNEDIKSNDIVITTSGSLGTSNKVAYTILDYLIKPDLGFTDYFHANLENSLISNNPNDIPIITDMLSAYLQGNRNSLENQKASILFNGNMNLAGSFVGAVGSAATGNVGGIASNVISAKQGTGNTVLALQAMNAKKQDINNTPPAMAKMGSNTSFDWGNNLTGMYLIKKQIKAEYRKKLGDFFHMFGYKLNEVKLPNFHTRNHWNYVQTESCTILGNFNNEDLNELKAIFDNGITLWHTDEVGNYALENGVI